MAMPATVPGDSNRLLADPTLRADLMRFVRVRVSEAEAEDVVQTTLADALSAKEKPSNPEELRRWVFGIAKNKVADTFRRAMREVPREAPGDEATAESAPLSARDLLRWAENELPEAEGAASTLEWALREGAGEKLEHIADEEKVPAARVRQRVSRLRRHYRARWAAQLAAAAALLILALAVWAIWRGRATPGPDDIAQEKPSPREKATELRRVALERCHDQAWRECLDGLDRAKAIDPVGDQAEAIQKAREAAARGLEPAPTAPQELETPPMQKKAPSPAPTPSAAPVPTEPPPPMKTQAPQSSEPAPSKVPTKAKASKGTFPSDSK